MKYRISRVAVCFWGVISCDVPMSAENDAVLLHMGDDLQQVRVEACDPETGHWLAIASGYRDKAEPGWLKIALSESYVGAHPGCWPVL